MEITCVIGFCFEIDRFSGRNWNGNDVACPFRDADFLPLLSETPFHLCPFTETEKRLPKNAINRNFAFRTCLKGRLKQLRW